MKKQVVAVITFLTVILIKQPVYATQEIEVINNMEEVMERQLMTDEILPEEAFAEERIERNRVQQSKLQPSRQEDRKEPEITITGVEEEVHYKKGMDIVAEIKDSGLDVEKTMCVLVNTKGEQFALEQNTSREGLQFVWKKERWETEKGKGMKSGVYKLRIEGEDLSGNYKNKELSFVFNNEGSRYEIKKVKTANNKNNEENVMIVEKNHSPIKERKVFSIWEGEPHRLIEGKDYRGYEEKKEDIYYYQYEIEEQDVKKKGIHALQIMSFDQAGNETYYSVNFAVGMEPSYEKKGKPINESLKREQTVESVSGFENTLLFIVAAVCGWKKRMRSERIKKKRGCREIGSSK